MIADTMAPATSAGVAVDQAPVVVATLGDDEPFAAVAWANALARDVGCPIVVIDAEPTDAHPSIANGEPARCRNVADALRRRLDAAGLGADEIRCERGTPSDVVLDAAAGARLLVIESHRVKEGHRYAHGHLAPELARRADCPLLVVPRGRLEPPGRILVGVDGRSGNRAVLDWAHAIGDAFDCPITAVHVRDPLASMFCTRHGDPTVRRARRAAAGAGDVELITRTGEHPAVELLDEARARSAGLIVVGTKQTPGVFTPILGYVTARLLEQDDVAVAVVPEDDVER